MTSYISDANLEKKVRVFADRSVNSLDCFADFHFEDALLRLPVETKDGKVFESTFCHGYQEEKYLLALSTQIGCATRCSFCELGRDGLSRSLTDDEIVDQLTLLLNTAMRRGYDVFSKKLKASFVMGGEPLANKHLGRALERMRSDVPLQTKISTVFPAFERARNVYRDIVSVAEDYPNIVQFQVSVNSTDEEYRQCLVSIPLASFEDIRAAGELWFGSVPDPRKIDLTFTLNEGTPMDPGAIKDVLPPDMFAIRLRDYVSTRNGQENGIEILSRGRIAEMKDRFEDAGYFFVPGMCGDVEHKFRLAPGESIGLYNRIRN